MSSQEGGRDTPAQAEVEGWNLGRQRSQAGRQAGWTDPTCSLPQTFPLAFPATSQLEAGAAGRTPPHPGRAMEGVLPLPCGRKPALPHLPHPDRTTCLPSPPPALTLFLFNFPLEVDWGTVPRLPPHACTLAQAGWGWQTGTGNPQQGHFPACCQTEQITGGGLGSGHVSNRTPPSRQGRDFLHWRQTWRL